MEVDLAPWQNKPRGFLEKLEKEGGIEPGLIEKIQDLQ